MSIIVENLSYIYQKGSPFEVEALKGINLEIKNSEFIGLVGHTGCGKSTLIQHFNCLLRPASGRVLIDNIDIFKKGINIKSIRASVGLVFQYPEHQLFEETVYDDIAFGPKNFGVPPGEIEHRVKDAIASVGLDFDKMKNRSPFSLSGGEKRRVAIASILASKPRYLILDEPTAGLDPKSRDKILLEVKKMHDKEGITVILVTHDMNHVAALAQKVFVMEKGKIVLQGNLKEVFSNVEVLEGYSLDVPEITRLMYLLKERGLEVNTDIYTVEEAEEELKKHKKKMKGK